MRVANLKIENFRGVRSGFVRFGKHPVLVGDNNAGKTTLIEALALLLGRDRLVRELTEHDFYGSCPQPADRIKLMPPSLIFRMMIQSTVVIGFGKAELSLNGWMR